MANNTNTNPGSVNVADEAFGLGVPSQTPPFISVPVTASPNNKIEIGGSKRPDVVTQEIVVGASQSAGPTVLGGASSAKLTTVDQEIVVGPSQTHLRNVNGGSFSPQSANTINTTQNTVIGQTYGTGVPINVNV